MTTQTTFWNETSMEPKRNYRFQVSIGGQNGKFTGLHFWAKTVDTPSFDVTEVEHNYYDNKYYYPGRVSWSEVTLTLVDPISPDAVQLTNKILIDSGYNIPKDPTSANQKATISKKKANAAGFKKLSIHVVNAEGFDLEVWTLNNPFIKSAKYGDLDYSNDELRTVEMSIRYDWATCEIMTGTTPQTQFGVT